MVLSLLRSISRLSDRFPTHDDAEIVGTRPSFAECIVMVGGAM